MTLLLKQIFNFFKLLNSDTGTNQISAGVAVGLILGFAPAFSLQTILVIILLFMFRIQIGAATLSAFFFKFGAYLLDPVSDSLGRAILENEGLKPLFTTLYNMPIVPFTRFNNSIFMGSGVLSIILAPIVFFLARFLVVKYRVQVVARFQETKLWKTWKATKLFQWYSTYDNLYGR